MEKRVDFHCPELITSGYRDYVAVAYGAASSLFSTPADGGLEVSAPYKPLQRPAYTLFMRECSV